jgi:hypothetical protein
MWGLIGPFFVQNRIPPVLADMRGLLDLLLKRVQCRGKKCKIAARILEQLRPLDKKEIPPTL